MAETLIIKQNVATMHIINRQYIQSEMFSAFFFNNYFSKRIIKTMLGNQ